MFDTNILMVGLIFSSIGMGYFVYGKKNNRSLSLLSGIILMIYPYFITNLIYLILIGIVLILLPILIKLEF